MEKINSIIKEKANKEKLKNNVINVNNVIDKNKYALDESKFKPFTKETLLAKEMAKYLNDLKNFAFYYFVVKNIGALRAQFFFDGVKRDIMDKAITKHPVKDPKKYFVWKYKKGLY